jgi:NitT/TauT family transport system substrate-binding protein
MFIGIVIIAVIGISVGGCQEKPVEKITVAIGTGPVTSLIHIAFVKGYFENEGLDLVIQQHQSGKSAFNAVVEGEVDLATAAETPIMLTVMRGEKIYILATISSTEKNKMIVARKDKGISIPNDLKGKKIGVPVGTNAEFFMDSFLIMHGISRDEVEVINVESNAIVDTLTSGEVDAVSTWNPNISILQKELGDNGVTFSGEGIYRETFNIAAKQDFANENPETINKVLRALIKAEEFIEENPDEASEIVAGRIGMDKAALNELWGLYNFKVTLDQSLLVTLEAEARWAIENKLTEATEIPNYLDYIYMDALEEVKPEAVGIIR